MGLARVLYSSVSRHCAHVVSIFQGGGSCISDIAVPASSTMGLGAVGEEAAQTPPAGALSLAPPASLSSCLLLPCSPA